MRRTMRSSAALATGAVGVALVLALAVAIPAAGQDPSPSGASDATAKPGVGPKANRAERPTEVPVSLAGRVGTRSGEDGGTGYTLTVGSTVYDLHVGPPWWWGEDHPLEAYAGRTVTITGERAEGSTAVDVFTVDGTTVREAGRPPWAGGWKAVGPRHPGWSQWKADKAAARGAGKAAGPPPWAGPRTPEDAGD